MAPASTPGLPVQLSPEELGDLHLARRRFQAAIESYQQVPVKTALIWNKVGMAHQQMLSMDEARKSYQTALKLDPKNPDILNNMGTIYYSMKDYGNAEKYYRKALKLNPKSALIYKNLGTALLAGNKFRKGWDCYQSALAIEPDIFERSYPYRIGEPTPALKRGAMNYYLALSYARAGNSTRAVDYLRMAINEGFTDRHKVMVDKDFAVLRTNEAFVQLIAESSRQ